MSKSISLGVILALAACGPMVDEAELREAIPVDRFSELEIVSDEVTIDARTRNTGRGPWSFARALGDVEAQRASATADSFLQAWQGASVRSDEVRCLWLAADVRNQCNVDCSVCSHRDLHFDSAPFRLIAISNRLDLRRHPDSPTGEARLVFGLTSGAADRGAAPLGLTVIFEYALCADVASEVWAHRFHALGSLKGDDYLRALETLTRDFAKPMQLSQVRVLSQLQDRGAFAELTVADGWQARGLRNSPNRSQNGSNALSAYVKQNQSAITSDANVMSESMRAKTLGLGESKWEVPQVDESVRRAFALGTCDGCHGQEVRTLDGGFHISPFRQGRERLSPFLHNRNGNLSDELARREDAMRALLATGR